MPIEHDMMDDPKFRELMTTLAREGRMRTDDGRALLMYPEDDVDMSREEDLHRTHVVCGRCSAITEVRHRRPMDEVRMPRCPLCKAMGWRLSDVSRGVREDGCISVPRTFDGVESLPKIRTRTYCLERPPCKI